MSQLLPTGVLALQGAFREHLLMLQRLGQPCQEVRQLPDLAGIGSLIIPGGESTTIGKLLVELGMLEPVREKIRAGMPVFGTCAGLILLCDKVADRSQPGLGVLDATVRRNAFGRQRESFEALLPVPAVGPKPFPAVFIRAPILEAVGPGVEVLARIPQGDSERPVAVRQGHLLATSFHPELTPDTRIHRYFLDMAAAA